MIKTRWLKIFDAEGSTYLFNTHRIAEIRYGDSDGGDTWGFILIAEGLATSNFTDFTYTKNDAVACKAYEDSLINILALEKLG